MCFPSFLSPRTYPRSLVYLLALGGLLSFPTPTSFPIDPPSLPHETYARAFEHIQHESLMRLYSVEVKPYFVSHYIYIHTTLRTGANKRKDSSTSIFAERLQKVIMLIKGMISDL